MTTLSVVEAGCVVVVTAVLGYLDEACDNSTDGDGENYKEYDPCNCHSYSNSNNIIYTEGHDKYTLNCIIYSSLIPRLL